MCEIISLRTNTILIGSRPKATNPQTTFERVFLHQGETRGIILGFGHLGINFSILPFLDECDWESARSARNNIENANYALI
jgi:hypothetical protein